MIFNSLFSHDAEPVQLESQCLDIKRLLAQGDIQAAYTQAEALLNQTLQAGEGAAIAKARFMLGSVLRCGESYEAALESLQQARLDFEALAAAGNQDAARMLSVTLIAQGDCLTAIGQLEVAVELYAHAIALAEQLQDLRQVAVGKEQLATVYFFQQNYPAALTAYQQAKDLFSQLNEPQSIAVSWHQIGVVYTRMQDYEQAEQACHESLTIKNAQGNQADIASTLNQLGNIYSDSGKLEQAVDFYSLAAEYYAQLGDKRYEGVTRSNIADSLIPLKRYDEARRELQRAIDCKKDGGYPAEPWKTWNILSELEQAVNNPIAAHAAKQQAIQSYLAYRRDGNENLSGSPVPQFCSGTLRAIQENNTSAAEKDLRGLQDLAGLADYLNPVIAKLIAILRGERNPSLADDPELDFISAAEFLLLLDALT
jgi:tetratricopeptide (TPR) repeat protein